MKLLKVDEVAALLQLKKTTVYEMIKRGELASTRIGKQLRIAEAELTKLIGTSYVSQVNESSMMSSAEQAAENIILCGQDAALDVIANYCNTHLCDTVPVVLRSHAGSYNSLHKLYLGKVQIATAHLWDEETKSYNISYIKRLLPGQEVVVIRLFGSRTGFYVQQGNPLHITDWADLKKKQVILANREKGSATRILLDEKRMALGIAKTELKGYFEQVYTSHLAAASAIASGNATVAIGSEQIADQVKGITFVPLQTEWYDMVILEDYVQQLPYHVMINYITSGQFAKEISNIGHYDCSETGRIWRISV